MFAYLVYGLFRKYSTKRIMLTLLSIGVAKFVRMWPKFVAKWRGLLFFAMNEKKKEKEERRMGLPSVLTLLNLPTKFSMETSDEILPSVITL